MIIVNVQKLDPYYLSPHDIEEISGTLVDGRVYSLSWFGEINNDVVIDSIEELLREEVKELAALVEERQDQAFVLVDIIDDNVIEVVGVADMSKLYLLLRSDNVSLSSSN